MLLCCSQCVVPRSYVSFASRVGNCLCRVLNHAVAWVGIRMALESGLVLCTGALAVYEHTSGIGVSVV